MEMHKLRTQLHSTAPIIQILAEFTILIGSFLSFQANVCIKTVMNNLSSILGFITIISYHDLLIF